MNGRNSMKRRVAAIIVTLVMVIGMLSGCKSTDGNKETGTNGGTNTKGTTESASPTESNKDTTEETKEIKEFTAFFAVEGSEINDDNEIQQIIADKIGAKCKETWLTGQTAEEAIGMLIAGGEYPDFVVGSTGQSQLLEAGAFIPLDEYWDDYPNIKNFWSEEEWNKVRSEDGHIYTIPQFGNEYMYDTETTHWDEAFWIQTRVLKWAGYPEINTLDELFDLLEKYYAENPTMEDGTPIIPYEILTDDWYYYCLENPPQFLDGYPNDGSVLVDPSTNQVIDYNTTDTAYRYFKKLNEEYKKGIIDPEAFTMSRDQYIEKLSSGRVLCMVDQYWNFNTAVDSIKSQGLNDCTYVPLGLTIDEGMNERYHSGSAIDVSNGLGITVSCKDVKGALQFVNDILSEEIMILRMWGEEGADYLVDEDGLFYRTQEMRDNAVDAEYKAAHLCTYNYFPQYEGMCLDGINACGPANQPSEFYESLSPEIQECLAAYDCQTYVEMLNPSTELSPWFPMWSYSNTLTTATEGGLAWTQMGEVKHEYLPKVVIASDFDASWDEYMKVYEKCNPKAFLAEMQEEVYRRIEVATGENVRP